MCQLVLYAIRLFANRTGRADSNAVFEHTMNHLADLHLARQAMLGPTKLLASGRTGRQIAVNRSDNPVFVESNSKLLCHHGERSGSIMAWLAIEHKDPTYVRPSVCDCGNIDGLMSDYALDADSLPDPVLERLSLYKLLEQLGAEKKKVNSRPQCKALTTNDGEVWVQPAGTIVCTHGNSKKVLTRLVAGKSSFKHKSLVKCNCVLNVPRRAGSIFATHTKTSKKALSSI